MVLGNNTGGEDASPHSDSSQLPIHVMILPGNGCHPIERANWYSWLAEKLKQHKQVEKVVCSTMPDPNDAREDFWIPFAAEKMELRRSTSTETSEPPPTKTARHYLIGHSSGAVCIMRLLEKYTLDGVILVSGCVDHLGHESERISCYYPSQPDESAWAREHGPGTERPWRWDLMKQNSGFFVHIGGKDDPFIPVSAMREIKGKMDLVGVVTRLKVARHGTPQGTLGREHIVNHPHRRKQQFPPYLQQNTKRGGRPHVSLARGIFPVILFPQVDGDTYFEYEDMGHFMSQKCPEILAIVEAKLGLER